MDNSNRNTESPEQESLDAGLEILKLVAQVRQILADLDVQESDASVAFAASIEAEMRPDVDVWRISGQTRELLIRTKMKIADSILNYYSDLSDKDLYDILNK